MVSYISRLSHLPTIASYLLKLLIILFLAGRLHAKWDHQIGLTCVITKTNNKILTAIFIYAMVYDLVALLLTTYKLFANSSSETFARSRLTQVICVDGLFFFIVASV